MDTLILSRIQFGANISFHILFPTITIAMGWALLTFRLRYVASGDERWMAAYRFWVKVFALSFALGVVSGITMSFQFGTNWPGYMQTVGNIAGPLLAYEVLTAFFLEAAFLGIMLFGFNRVPGWMHILATVLVAIGTTLSAFWILVLNSWMQTPQGFEMIDGVAHATDWFEIVFNPSMPYRMAHMLLASGLTCAFLIAGISAYRILIGDQDREPRMTFRWSVWVAAALIPIQIFAGDQHGLNTLEHQPQKIAAMEANWETGPNVPLLLFAWPDEAERRNDFEIAVPHGASLILTHSLSGVVPGLNDYYAEDGTALHPPVAALFWSFRVMVAVGLAMLALAWFGAFMIWRKGGTTLLNPWLLRGFVAMSFSGWVATLAGWYTTEIGRQPWLVQDVLTTEAAVAHHSTGMVASSLALYLAVYAVLLIAYVAMLFILARRAAQGSLPEEPERSGAATVAVAGE
ncbi:cytochrome ubiquinol oxidase subunit I [Pikeienuella piscinae]|uniref:Cytochrome ubiquinol oxidase subunit I n=1 Tax=Pikeienuella piscinae TaxID=2748098 RepID=A0A7L5BVG5_9RHOB|nr:cytochrome ubiquinol oxidase subunit I [Pikeienuella piscinae]QIE55732.1 cytochrome ubiquinol oxidase subunit I [Pikeienuella piscinae]